MGWWWVVAGLALALGCGESHDHGPPRVPMPGPPLEFTECQGAFDERTSFELPVECASADVPKQWDDPDGERIDLVVERLTALDHGAPPMQIWLLQGGPGGSSLGSLLAPGDILRQRIPGAEILVVDHRGVRGSDFLGCPVQQGVGSPGGTTITDDELAACFTDVRGRLDPEDLYAYSMTSAARDLGELIARTRRDGVPVFVYSVSYGTAWAQRWLQLFPDQADGVILDSICSPGRCVLPRPTLRVIGEVGASLLDACAADPTCRANFGHDPQARGAAVLDMLDAGHCPGAQAIGFDSHSVRRALAVMLASLDMRQAIPALLFRLERCTPEDVTALGTSDWLVTAPGDGDERSLDYFSWVLFHLIRRSEMWEDPAPSFEELEAEGAGRLFWPPFFRTPEVLAAWEMAPRYEPDELFGAFAATDVPILMMNGSMDPQTGLADARPTAEHFTGPGQTFVEIDRAVHSVLSDSIYEEGTYFDTCGMDLLLQFVRDPHATLDTSCRTETSYLDFSDPLTAGFVFGTDSMW